MLCLLHANKVPALFLTLISSYSKSIVWNKWDRWEKTDSYRLSNLNPSSVTAQAPLSFLHFLMHFVLQESSFDYHYENKTFFYFSTTDLQHQVAMLVANIQRANRTEAQTVLAPAITTTFWGGASQLRWEPPEHLEWKSWFDFNAWKTLTFGPSRGVVKKNPLTTSHHAQPHLRPNG